MILSDLINKSKPRKVATLTVATIATQDAETKPTVAKVASVTVANPTELKIDEDDRHHCRECLHLRNGHCFKQRFRPVDDIPRRCEDFSGLSPIIEQRARRTTSSEAEHNAQGRFFKFLITRQDGTQFYSCSMPRMALKEAREQYPDAAGIEPVSGENYNEKLNIV